MYVTLRSPTCFEQHAVHPCKFTPILTFITDPTQDVTRHFINFTTRQMFSLLHLTSSLGFTSLITAILFRYCFIWILF